MAQEINNRRVLAIAVPIVLSNITVPILGAVDTAVIGQLGKAAPVAAVGVGAIIITAFYWIFGFLRMGTVGMVSQANGAQNHYEIVNIVLRNLLFVIILSITLIIFQNLILKISLNIFELNNETIIFLKIILPASSFSFTKCTVHPVFFSFFLILFQKVFNPLNLGKRDG